MHIELPAVIADDFEIGEVATFKQTGAMSILAFASINLFTHDLKSAISTTPAHGNSRLT